ncbi:MULTISPECIES: hypothetical protein [unclassified Lactobacillus]|uniref:hypothetical protein n=1 Tax=unclassified Lactobacillus TaxID=2620435 RepID=UPI000F17698B|nr:MULTISPECIES: hypothetical protein [unclassified Lactobacillus]RMC43343.1 hypothetical protein F5ESL0236_07735 [Lactobacillus sp. ESL0236]
MKKNNLKVWQYFSWTLAGVVMIVAFASRPNENKLSQINEEIQNSDKIINQAKKASNAPVKVEKQTTFDLVAAKKQAASKLSQGLSKALGGYKDSTEYNQHRQELDDLFGRDFDTKLYKLNGLPDDTYSATANAKFKFTITKPAKADIGFNDVSDLSHAKAVAIVRYKPNYLKYGVIRIINIDYDLQKQKVNTASLRNLQNPQLKGYEEDE